MPIRARLFIFFTVVSGATILGYACFHWHSDDLLKFACYLLISLLAATMKVKLPGLDSLMSVFFLFALLGILELSLAETLIIGCGSALVQCFWKQKNKPEPVKVIFNIFSNQANAIFISYLAYHFSARFLGHSAPLSLFVATLSYFLCNTFPIAIVISLTEGVPLRGMWKETYFWTLPYYMAGASVVGIIHFANHYIGWQSSLLIVPVMFAIFRSFQLYLARLEEQKKRVQMEELQVVVEKRHVEEVCALHMRTIEGLALAIDAKDQTTHDHLQRVHVYATEIAKELDLSDLSKPGKLTPEEFFRPAAISVNAQ